MIFHRYPHRRRVRRVRAAQPIEHFLDLNSGDYVVHQSHGIARYLGIAAIEKDGAAEDFLTLLFAGEGQTGGPFFRAHDKATGEVVAELELPATQVGLPMTYMHEGRQFIVMAIAGGGGSSAEFIALALPQ